MLDWIAQGFRFVFDLMKQHPRTYEVVVGVTIVLWLVAAFYCFYRWERRSGSRLIHGPHFLHRLAVGITSLACILLIGWPFSWILLAFCVWFPFLSYVVLGGLGLLILITIVWTFSVRRLEIDLEPRTYRFKKGFLVFVKTREGTLDDIDHILVSRVNKGKEIHTTISLVWKDDETSYPLYRLKEINPNFIEKGMLFLSGWSKWVSRFKERQILKFQDKLQWYQENLGLPVREQGDQAAVRSSVT